MQWEYIVEVISGNKQEAEIQLNKLGANGWEAIAVWLQGKNLPMLFKRPKSK